jgi:hypothetical protein
VGGIKIVAHVPGLGQRQFWKLSWNFVELRAEIVVSEDQIIDCLLSRDTGQCSRDSVVETLRIGPEMVQMGERWLF